MKIMTKQAQNINDQFEQVSKSLNKFRAICDKNGSPLRVVTFRVKDCGLTKLHVTYKRIGKKK